MGTRKHTNTERRLAAMALSMIIGMVATIILYIVLPKLSTWVDYIETLPFMWMACSAWTWEVISMIEKW